MMPLEKLAAEILVWGILSGFSTLIFLLGGWPAIGAALVFGYFLYDRVCMFKFVYDNTRELHEPD